MKIVIVSGGFDPIHSGHIAYFEAAKNLGDILIVALNSDEWLINKKDKFFMPFSERKKIIENIKYVNEVIDFKDDKYGSATNAIIKVVNKYPNDEIIFANGGDRSKENSIEESISGVSFHFGVGGVDKKNSSSWILKEWSYECVKRSWGEYYVLFSDKDVVVKELIVNPNQGMSFQRHFHRNEIWLVTDGECEVNFGSKAMEGRKNQVLKKHDKFVVNKKEWHQIINPTQSICKIIEIQYGDNISEQDIERLEYFNKIR